MPMISHYFCEVRKLADGRLMFETGIDNSGFSSRVSNLQATANVAMGNIAANMISQMSSATAQIPQQMISVGSGYEASIICNKIKYFRRSRVKNRRYSLCLIGHNRLLFVAGAYYR